MTGGTDNNRKLINTYTDKSGIPISTYSGKPQQTQVKTGDTPIWGKVLSLIENPGTFANFLTNLKGLLIGATRMVNQTALKDHTVISLGTKVTLDYMEELQEGANKTAEANKDNPSIKKNIEDNLKKTIIGIATLQTKESEVQDLRSANDRSKLQELHQSERELNIMRASQRTNENDTRDKKFKMSIALGGIGHELMGKGEIKDKNVLYPDIVAQCNDNIKYGGYNTMRECVDDFTTRILEKAEQEANPETKQKLKDNFKSAIAVKYTEVDIKSGLYPWSTLSPENRAKIEAFCNS